MRRFIICYLLLGPRLLSSRWHGFTKGRMLKISRAANGEVAFTLSGRMDSESIAELERLLGWEVNGRQLVVDLRDVTLVNQDAVNFLKRCEAGGITLRNCPVYIREWIMSQKSIRVKPMRGRRSGSDND